MNFFSYFHIPWSSILSGLTITSIIAGTVAMALVPSLGKIIASTWEALLYFAKPILSAVGEAVVFFFKTFFEGLKVCFSNLSTLSVILVAIIGGGWYFRTWNDNVIKVPLQKEIVRLNKKIENNDCKVTPKKRHR